MFRTLSKSDFKLAAGCATKLYYKELGYPQANDGNPYLKLLADGGYMVEQLARRLYPEGIELSYAGNAEENARATAELLTRENVTLFEATLLSGRKLARVDILKKMGNRFELVEVKSTSFDGEEAKSRPAGPFRQKTKKAAILTDWIPYLEDVTFQFVVLQELYPAAEIAPHLLLVDKSQTTSVDALPGLFDIRRDVIIDGRTKDLDIRFVGDADTPAARELLRCVDVSSEVAELAPAVAEAAGGLVALYRGDEVTRVQRPIDWNCKGCEFRVATGEGPNGFVECWGTLAEPTPHLFDLYQFGNNKIDGERVADTLIRQGKTSLYDIDPTLLMKRDGEPTAYTARQVVQIEHTRSATPFIDPALSRAIASWQWPLHFIDFETSALALPYHAGMRPYEMVGFQWSSHTLRDETATPVHAEWLNERESWPCLAFVESLRQAVGETGTVLMWSHHEATTLKKIRDQMDRYNVGDAAIREWMGELVGVDDGPRRLVDMNDLCRKYFFHPGMAGRTSIKIVLDALWKSDAAMRDRFAAWMGDRSFAVTSEHGPYESLPPIVVGGLELEVFEGTGAMRAYQAMLYGEERHSPEIVAAYRELLLRYCKLDTLAMVLIWDHWRNAPAPEG
ncbi:MAG: DUF2779 domain-containing protein [Gemmatimonadales bacterium]